MIEPIDIARAAVEKLRENIRATMLKERRNATGGTSAGIGVIPSQGQGFGQALLEADFNWKWVGNGRGPGKMPPIGPIQAWINARGLKISAWGVARKIGAEGSRDFRRKGENTFLSEIDKWEKDAVPKAEGEFVELMEDRAVELINTTLK